MPRRRASTYVPTPHSTHDSSATAFIARTGLCVSHRIGAAKNPLPMRCSEKASVRWSGAKMFASKIDSG